MPSNGSLRARRTIQQPEHRGLAHRVPKYSKKRSSHPKRTRQLPKGHPSASFDASLGRPLSHLPNAGANLYTKPSRLESHDSLYGPSSEALSRANIAAPGYRKARRSQHARSQSSTDDTDPFDQKYTRIGSDSSPTLASVANEVPKCIASTIDPEVSDNRLQAVSNALSIGLKLLVESKSKSDGGIFDPEHLAIIFAKNCIHVVDTMNSDHEDDGGVACSANSDLDSSDTASLKGADAWDLAFDGAWDERLDEAMTQGLSHDMASDGPHVVEG